MENKDYLWTDNPVVSGIALCDTDVLNDCLMHLKYNNSNGLPLFFMLTTDRALTGADGVGWALQGSYVTMTYPDAVNMILTEYEQGTNTTYRGISCKYSVTGRYIADISKKDEVDELYAASGIADLYVVDTVNNAFYLPKTKWFTQYTTELTALNRYNAPGLPDHQHSPIYLTGSNADLGDVGQCYLTNNDQQNGVQTSKNSRTGNVSNNSLYGQSTTVQPPSSNKFLYYKVGDVVTSAATALIDAEEYIDEALTDIEEAVADGLSTLSNASSALTKTQLANCILEAPNGVATYSGTTITVKQGLKFLVPNGRNADGSLKNIEYVVSADTSFNAAVESLTTYTRNIIIFVGSNNIEVSSLSDNIPLYYQETQPSKFFQGFAYWYNTAENKVYYSEGNSVFTEALAIIIGSYTINSSAITALRTDKAVSLAKWSDIEYTSRHIVTKYYRNGTSWYRLWSDGFLEQGGIGPSTGIVQLIKAYSDTNYSKLLTSKTTGGAIYCAVVESAGATTTSSFKVVGSTTQTTWWYTTGYAG